MVVMKILGDMTHKEIAQALSIPIGTVQWLYVASIKKLRRSLTVLASMALIFGGGFGYQLVQYFQTPVELPGDVGISSIPTVEPALSLVDCISAAVSGIRRNLCASVQIFRSNPNKEPHTLHQNRCAP